MAFALIALVAGIAGFVATFARLVRRRTLHGLVQSIAVLCLLAGIILFSGLLLPKARWGDMAAASCAMTGAFLMFLGLEFQNRMPWRVLRRNVVRFVVKGAVLAAGLVALAKLAPRAFLALGPVGIILIALGVSHVTTRLTERRERKGPS